MASTHKQSLLQKAKSMWFSDRQIATVVMGDGRVFKRCFLVAALFGLCGCAAVPLNVRHSREAKYYPYEGATCSRTGEVATVYFQRYLPEVPLVLTLWTDKLGPVAINDPRARAFSPLRLPLGRQPDLNALTNTIPKLAVGYGNDFTSFVFGYFTTVSARGEMIWIPLGSLYAAKMVSAITQNFDQTDVEGDVQQVAELPSTTAGHVFIITVKKMDLFERPLNHINMDLELGLTWKPPGGGPAIEFSSIREVRAESLGSIMTTSSALLDNLNRIVDTELNGAAEELMKKMCETSISNGTK
jgi:hypothetical protein